MNKRLLTHWKQHCCLHCGEVELLLLLFLQALPPATGVEVHARNKNNKQMPSNDKQSAASIWKICVTCSHPKRALYRPQKIHRSQKTIEDSQRGSEGKRTWALKKHECLLCISRSRSPHRTQEGIDACFRQWPQTPAARDDAHVTVGRPGVKCHDAPVPRGDLWTPITAR